jgi:hypothetical protein
VELLLAVTLAGVVVGGIAVMVGVIGVIVSWADQSPTRLEERTKVTQERFLDERKLLRGSRVPLADRAKLLYPSFASQDLPLLFDRGWLPARPMELKDVHVIPDGGIAAARPSRRLESGLPYTAAHRRYRRYADAIGDLDRPTQFENRACYRLVAVEPAASDWTIRVCKTHYFDMLNTCEAVGFEFAGTQMDDRGELRTPPATVHFPPGRKGAGSPFQFDRRCVVPGINTLTVRSDGADTGFFMHRRQTSDADPDSVATAMGTNHVVPAGEFQPASIDPTNFTEDADMWRTILREYAEELWGLPEAAGRSGAKIDYERDEPYRSINKARAANNCWARFLGLGIDPLSLKAEVLTVCVFRAAEFDRIFGKALARSALPKEVGMSRNAEGVLLTGHDYKGIPFDHRHVLEFTSGPHETLPAGAACLALAWQWQDWLKSPIPGKRETRWR